MSTQKEEPMSARRLALLPILLGASVALATPTHGVAQEGSEGQNVHVSVQNRMSGSVRVYVLQQGHMVPLGLVAGAGHETFALPPGFKLSDEGIQLLADPLGSTDWYKSDPVTVHPGGAVDFTVANSLDKSSVSVAR